MTNDGSENSCHKGSKLVCFLSVLILSIAIGGGLLGAGYFIGKAKQSDRYVEVKGFDERIVKADFVNWVIAYKSTGVTMEDALQAAEKSQVVVLQFLKDNGFKDDEVEVGQVKVTDKQADAYNQNNSENRFIVDSNITLRTAKVDEVVKLSQQTLALAKNGVTLASDYYNQGPKFEFRGLSSIKPEMIANATKNARDAAAQFAKDSGSGVGAIRNASQGYFTVESMSAIDGQTSISQKVRVVSTIQFFLGE